MKYFNRKIRNKTSCITKEQIEKFKEDAHSTTPNTSCVCKGSSLSEIIEQGADKLKSENYTIANEDIMEL